MDVDKDTEIEKLEQSLKKYLRKGNEKKAAVAVAKLRELKGEGGDAAVAALRAANNKADEMLSDTSGESASEVRRVSPNTHTC